MDEVVTELFRVTAPDGKGLHQRGGVVRLEDEGRYRRVPLRSHVMELCRDAGFDFFDEFVWIKDQYATHGDGALLGSYPIRRMFR